MVKLLLLLCILTAAAAAWVIAVKIYKTQQFIRQRSKYAAPPKRAGVTDAPPRGANGAVRAGDMMLVDSQGLAILRYEVPASTAAWPLLGKAVLSDLQQLLKYQRGVQ